MEIKLDLKTYEKQGNLYLKLVLLTADNELTLCEQSELEGFKKSVDQLIDTLNNIKLSSEELYKKFCEEKEKEESLDIEILWKRMEGMDDEELISFFNSLDTQTRKEISDYVFSKVNMFKGKGVLFANYFNYSSYFLEK